MYCSIIKHSMSSFHCKIDDHNKKKKTSPHGVTVKTKRIKKVFELCFTYFPQIPLKQQALYDPRRTPVSSDP